MNNSTHMQFIKLIRFTISMLLLSAFNYAVGQDMCTQSSGTDCCSQYSFNFNYTQQSGSSQNEVDVDFTLTSIIGNTVINDVITNASCSDKVVKVMWDFDDDGTSDVINTSNPMVVQNTFTLSSCASSVFKIVVCVEFENGGICRFEQFITLNNANVVATHTITKTIGSCGQVTFGYTGTALNNPKWTFGDGQFDYTGQHSVSHTYPANGTYTVTLTDSEIAPCVIATTVTINGYPDLGFTYSVPDPCDATQGLDVTISNYNTSFIYLWDVNGTLISPSGATTHISSGLVSGQNNIVKLVAQNGNGCQANISKYIKIGGVSAEFNTPLEYCNGDNLTISGVQSGASSYDWIIYTGATYDAQNHQITSTAGATVEGTPTGMYAANYYFNGAAIYQLQLTVTTSYPNPSNPSSPIICTDVYAMEVTVYEHVDAEFSIASGNDCGEVVLAITNPSTTTAYSIDYGDGSSLVTGTDITSAPTNDLEHLYTSNGVYTITITLTNGTCTDVQTHNILINDQAVLGLAASNLNLCPGSSVVLTATIANTTNGVGGVTYSWEDISDPQNPIPISGTGPQVTVGSGGNYQVTATSGSNICFDNNQATITINELEAPTASEVSKTATSCGFSTGSATIQVSANLASVGYTINGGTVQNTVQTTINNLPAGPNYITIANAQDLTCTGTILINIDDNSPDVQVSTTDATCSANGSITITGVPGGYTTAVYDINSYPTTPIFTGLSGNVPAGNYVVEVTENAPGTCVVTKNVTVAGGAFALSLVDPILGICVGGNVDATLSASTPLGATIIWNQKDGNGNYINFGGTALTQNITQPGDYAVEVTDGTCTETLYFTVQKLNPITVSFQVTEPICPGDDAEVNTIVSGGSGNYTYLWSPSSTTNDNITLSPPVSGSVTVTVNDVNTSLGCGPLTTPAVPTINFPDPIELCTTGITPTPSYVGTNTTLAPTANYEDNIAINGCQLELCAQGGTQPLNYEWFLPGYTTTEMRQVTFTVNGSGQLEYTDPDPSSGTYGTTLTASTPASVTIPGYTSGAVSFNVNDPNITVPSGTYIYPYWMYDASASPTIYPALNTNSMPYTVDVQVTVTKDIMVHNHSATTTSTQDFSEYAEEDASGNPIPVVYTLVITDANGCSVSFLGIEITLPPVPDFPAFSFVWQQPNETEDEPEITEIDINLKDNMAEAANEMISNTMACLQSQLAGMQTAFEENCFDINTFRDETSISYNVNEHHYTLYYYDRAGQLTKTVPPQGVNLYSSNDIAEVLAYRKVGTIPATVSAPYVPSHTMKTTYQYNSLGQLISQNTPDGGTTNFIYDGLNRLRFSQNEQQKNNTTFSYTKYDELGRIIEVGESDATGLDFVTLTATNNGINADDALYPDNTQAGITNTEITKTVYTNPAQIDYYGLPQRYLQNRVSYVYNDDDGDLNTTSDQYYTYYSYDAHGNVEWLIQKDAELGKNYIAYNYDLISGNVLKVRYNENRQDKFFHKYEYDAENRLTNVYTSTDDLLWDMDANYEYYAHGPLKRNTIGEDHVQGLDYIYTIHGWLKSINTPHLSNADDPGNDGELVTAINSWQQTNKVAEDHFGMSLGYYTGDYQNSANFHTDMGNVSGIYDNLYASTNAADLYNGNISHWVHSQLNATTGQKDPSVKTRASIYNYDILNRIKQSTNLENTVATGTHTFAAYAGINGADAFKTNYSYDANGNILSLNRYNTAGDEMDDLSYTYDNGAGNVAVNLNRLSSVLDNNTSNVDGRGDLEDTHSYTYDGIGNLITETAKERMSFGSGYALYDVITNIDWTVYGKVKQVRKTVTLSGATYSVQKIDFEYDASGNRIKKTVFRKDDAAGTLTGAEADPLLATYLPDQITTTYYVRDAQGNTLAVYEKEAVENSSTYDVTINLKEQPIYGSDRLGQRTAQLAVTPTVNITSGNYTFPTVSNGLQVKSEYQNWITSTNRKTMIDATNQLCQEKVIHLEYDGSEYNTPTTTGIPDVTSFLGIAKNGVAIAENIDGELQFYVVLAEKYLGNNDACLIYDKEGHLMKNTELIANIDVNSKPVVINLSEDIYAVVTLNDNQQPMYHIVDMSAQGYGTLNNAGEVDANQVNVIMANNNPSVTTTYGLHYTAYEDHINNKKIVYTTRYTPNVALPNQGTTEIVAFEFVNNTTQLQEHQLYQINGCGNTAQGELQISPEGNKLLWYQHDKTIAGFDHRLFDVYSIALHPDKISTTGAVDILDHTQVNNYGGNYGEGRAEYMADNNTMLFSQRSIYLHGVTNDESDRNLWKYDPLASVASIDPLNPTSIYLFSEIRRGVNDKLYMPNMGAPADVIHSYDGTNPINPTGNTISSYNDYQFASALPTQVYKLYGNGLSNENAGRVTGDKQYELKDHLGSVRVVISDEKILNDNNSNDIIDAGDNFSPDVVSFSDTYPFGMSMRSFNPTATRYGFNGMEKNLDINNEGNDYTTTHRQYDARIGRWKSIDPKASVWETPYSAMANNPILYIDALGDTIRLYEIAKYQDKLPVYSFSNAAQSIKRGEYTIVPYYDANGLVIGYGAGRGDRLEFVMDEPSDIGKFIKRLELYTHASNLFYMNGTPDQNMIAFMAGDEWEGLKGMWKTALSSPSFYFDLITSIVGGRVANKVSGPKKVKPKIDLPAKKKTGGRLGSETTRKQNSAVADEMEKRGWKVTHGAGRGKEEYLKPLDKNSRKGGSYPDITATKDGKVLRVNTVDTRKNGQMTTRESNNADRIRKQTKGDHLLIIKKKTP